MTRTLTQTMAHRTARMSAAATLALLMTTTSALALEGKALFEELTGNDPDRIAYGSIEETSSDSFILSDVKMTNKKGEVSTAKTITFNDFREDGALIEVGEMKAEAFAAPVAGENGTTGRVVAETFAVSDAKMPREIFGGDIEKVKSERVVMGSLILTGLAGDQNGDGTDDFKMDRFAMDGLDAPLDWRMSEAQISAASGEPADPLLMKSMSLDGLSVDSPGGAFELASFAINDLRVPTSTIDASPLDWAKVYSTMDMGAVSFAMAGKPIFSMESMSASIDQVGETLLNSKSAVEGIFVDLTAIPDPKFQAVASQLGYTELRGRMAGDGSYDVAGGEIVVDDLVIDLKNVAKLSVSYKMSGYTPELAAKLNAASARAGGENANPLAILGLMGELMVDSAKIELTDDSITKKLLDFQAKQMGTTGDQLAAGAPMFIGMGMAQLGMPDFTTQVSTAMGTFLQNPGTLTIVAEPAAPVSFGRLIQASQQAPRALIEMLNVGVSAK